MPIEADGIRSGDYLTPSLKFAKEHALTTSVYHGEDYGVFVVLMGKDEYREASNHGEYIYIGEGKPARLVGIAKYNDEWADSEYQKVKSGSKEALSSSQSRLAMLVKVANLSKIFALKQTKPNKENRRRPLDRKSEISMILKMASETSLDTQGKVEQVAAKDIGQRLIEKLNITPASLMYKHLVSVGNYPSFEAWAKSLPKKLATGSALSIISNLFKPVRNPIFAAFGIPAIAEWNFDRIGTPETQLRYSARMLRRPLKIEDFSVEQREAALSLDSGEPKTNYLTGTLPPLVAYVLIRGTGDISELKRLNSEGIVEDSVLDFVNAAGLGLSDKRIALNREANKIIAAMRELYIFEDLPPA
tara:strand:- start:95 stop:1174 length:1080 start_codon:yes stop_codon:yes gene_type:complete